MAALTTTKELRTMQSDDLRKEIASQETLVLKLRMGVKLGKEKDSAKYIRERKQLARMKTVMSEKVGEVRGVGEVSSQTSKTSKTSQTSSKKSMKKSPTQK